MRRAYRDGGKVRHETLANLIKLPDHVVDAVAAALKGKAPSRMALFDLSSSWLEGSRCPLGARGYSRDAKKGTLQIEYGLLTDPEGRPVAVRVLEGDTADPAAPRRSRGRSRARACGAR